MKKNYENHEEFELVIKKCEEELMRQVSVECKHRGEILTIILNYYKQHKNQKFLRSDEIASAFELETEKKIIKLKSAHREEIELYKRKICELYAIIKSHDDIVSKTQQEVVIYKKKFFDVHKSLLEEQKKLRHNASSLIPENLVSGSENLNILNPLRSRRSHKTEYDADSFCVDYVIESRNGSKVSINETDHETFSPLRIRRISEVALSKSRGSQTSSIEEIENLFFELKKETLIIESFKDVISIHPQIVLTLEQSSQTEIVMQSESNSPLNSDNFLSKQDSLISQDEPFEDNKLSYHKGSTLSAIDKISEKSNKQKFEHKNSKDLKKNKNKKAKDEVKIDNFQKRNSVILQQGENINRKLYGRNSISIINTDNDLKSIKKKIYSVDNNNIKQLRAKTRKTSNIEFPKGRTKLRKSTTTNYIETNEKIENLIPKQLIFFQDQIIKKSSEIERLNKEIKSNREYIEEYLKLGNNNPNIKSTYNHVLKNLKKAHKGKKNDGKHFKLYRESTYNDSQLESVPEMIEDHKINNINNIISNYNNNDELFDIKNLMISKRNSISLPNTPSHNIRDIRKKTEESPFISLIYINGYRKGYDKGKDEGVVLGKNEGIQEGELNGYFKAVKEIKEQNFLSDRSEDMSKSRLNLSYSCSLTAEKNNIALMPLGHNMIQ